MYVYVTRLTQMLNPFERTWFLIDSTMDKVPIPPNLHFDLIADFSVSICLVGIYMSLHYCVMLVTMWADIIAFMFMCICTQCYHLLKDRFGMFKFFQDLCRQRYQGTIISNSIVEVEPPV